MKLSTYAKQLGFSYQTAWRLFKDGKLNAYTHLEDTCQAKISLLKKFVTSPFL